MTVSRLKSTEISKHHDNTNTDRQVGAIHRVYSLDV